MKLGHAASESGAMHAHTGASDTQHMLCGGSVLTGLDRIKWTSTASEQGCTYAFQLRQALPGPFCGHSRLLGLALQQAVHLRPGLTGHHRTLAQCTLRPCGQGCFVEVPTLHNGRLCKLCGIQGFMS